MLIMSHWIKLKKKLTLKQQKHQIIRKKFKLVWNKPLKHIQTVNISNYVEINVGINFLLWANSKETTENINKNDIFFPLIIKY